MFWFNFGKASAKPVVGSEKFTRFENNHQRLENVQPAEPRVVPTHPPVTQARRAAAARMRAADQGFANEMDDGSDPSPAILRAALPVRFGKIDDANVARIKASDAFEFSGFSA